MTSNSFSEEIGLTLTVGDGGQIEGNTETSIQAGVDYLAAAGGGTLRILPGKYLFSNAVYLRSNVNLLGEGPDTLLVKKESFESKLTVDSDWYESEITLDSVDGFDFGTGVTLEAKCPHHNGKSVQKRTIIGRDGKRFLLDKALEENFWADHEAVARTLFPLLSGDHVRNIRIENLRLDGNRENNVNLNGNYGGCIFMQDCEKIEIQRVESTNYNGDGVSWQICHDVTVENCLSEGNADLGFHPGSGSQRPVIRNNRSFGNSQGIFFCWGVTNGVAEDNEIRDSSKYGISIGHRDNDNLIRNNRIYNSASIGILFREESGGRDPLRNRFENNLIEDVGEYGIDLLGRPTGTILAKNRIVQKNQAGKGTGLRIGPDVADLRLEENTIAGFATKIEDRRV